jgi:hypothetical protein
MRNATKTRTAEAQAGATKPTQLERNVLDTSKYSSRGPVFFSFSTVTK